MSGRLRSTTFCLAIGCQKLGQPVPESNLVFESNSAVSQQMQRYTPVPRNLSYWPLKGRSVPSWRVTWYAAGESCARQASSDLTILGTVTTRNLRPLSSNSTSVTVPGSALSALFCDVGPAAAPSRVHPSASAASARLDEARKPRREVAANGSGAKPILRIVVMSFGLHLQWGGGVRPAIPTSH